MELLKKLFFSYQRLAWYINQAKGEYAKFGSFIPETLMIMTYLSVKGVKVETWHIPFFYVLVMIVAALIGKTLDLVGVVRYNQSLGNKRNDELIKILKDLEEIKEKLK